MLVSPKWQMMWLESQHCSKSIANWPLSSQQTQKILEDLKTSCCSPNKAVQLEALKCWKIWITHQNSEDWKLNTVCFTGIRPLITKKLQPLLKDVDICKMKLSLMWALLGKVQNIMQLEGPQYILEVFLQSCLTWLSSTSIDDCEKETSVLIFQLLLGIFKKDETLSGCDIEMFPPLSTDFFRAKKVFHRFVDKFLNIFTHWRKINDKSIFLRLWKYFLEHCELSCEYIPTPVWHRIFKLVGQICSEKNEPVKERLAFLHCCATSLKSALSPSKFIDLGNFLATPGEALLKKLVELCRVECKEFYDSEMFIHSKEICEVLLSKSMAIGGLDLCISILDVLEDFHLRSLFWGVWCGLVYCYKIQLLGIDKNDLTRTQFKFYRKLRGIAINFELDRSKLHKDCLNEVEKHIDVLKISCFCATSRTKNTIVKNSSKDGNELNALDLVKTNTENLISRNLHFVSLFPYVSNFHAEIALTSFCGKFSAITLYTKSNLYRRKIVRVKADVIKDILSPLGMNSAKPSFNCLFNFRFINLQYTRHNSLSPSFGSSDLSLRFKVGFDDKKHFNKSIDCPKTESSSPVPETIPSQKNSVSICEKMEVDEEVIPMRNTRSRKKAEEEKKKEMENQKRKRRRSFEVLVQEIVRKNKERKTEKNKRSRKSSVTLKGKRIKKKIKKESKKENQIERNKKERKPLEVSSRKLRNSKKERSNDQKKKEKKPCKTDGKLKSYFKVVTRKTCAEVKEKEGKKSQKEKKTKKKTKENRQWNSRKENGEKKNEMGRRQTSLKTMMNQRSKAVKVRQGLRTRHKAADATDGKQKIKKNNKKATDNLLAKLSPFKEVLHDHEYARLEPDNLKGFERILLAKKAVNVVPLKKAKKPEKEGFMDSETSKLLKPKLIKSEISVSKIENTEFQKPKVYPLQNDEISKTAEEKSAISISQDVDFIALEKSTGAIKPRKLETPEILNFQEEKEKAKMACNETELRNQFSDENKVKKFNSEFSQPKASDCQSNHDVAFQGSSEQITDNPELTPSKRNRKRVKMLDSLKPSKKIKVGEDFQEEKLPLEVTEKENLEEKPEFVSPTKKEKTETITPKNDESPQTTNGRISSRALRMIALVPESTKGSQIQRETSSRVEILKCKKAPNVDKNSRASKMLALLSENVAEFEEMDDVKVEEVNSNKGLANSPNMKTPASSLKLPKSVKKSQLKASVRVRRKESEVKKINQESTTRKLPDKFLPFRTRLKYTNFNEVSEDMFKKRGNSSDLMMPKTKPFCTRQTRRLLKSSKKKKNAEMSDLQKLF